VFDLAPRFGIRQRELGLGDGRPLARQLGVQRHEVLLAGGHVLFGIGGIHRALGNADRAVDALVQVDDQEVRSFAKRVDRTHVHAIGVLAPNAGFGDDKGHRCAIGVSTAAGAA
jgi:hypothetical protein